MCVVYSSDVARAACATYGTVIMTNRVEKNTDSYWETKCIYSMFSELRKTGDYTVRSGNVGYE
jgi:predicted fused transcriptional regulator/phosphomethylpyrimidine kinase